MRFTFNYYLYFPIFVYFVFAVLLSIIILGLSYLFTEKTSEAEKVSSYECGFDPFNDARNPFEVRFYLVAILFILFDIEAAFLFPWSVCLGSVSSVGYWSILDFLLELLIGLVYAWKIGALDWD